LLQKYQVEPPKECVCLAAAISTVMPQIGSIAVFGAFIVRRYTDS
jgi:hypothetical protein